MKSIKLKKKLDSESESDSEKSNTIYSEPNE
jgi:hypothetical protein